MALGGLGGPCQEQNSRIHLGAGCVGVSIEETPEPCAHPGRAPQGPALALRPLALPAPPSPPPPSARLPPPPRGLRGAGFFSGARWAGAGVARGRELGAPLEPSADDQCHLGFPPSPRAFWLISFKLSLVGPSC